MIFARIMPEFYIKIARKKYVPPLPPVSYAYGPSLYLLMSALLC